MQPFFSIVVPVHNTAPYLAECLDSLLAQTFAGWEAVCIDDGSSDGSGAILADYAARDGRIRVFSQPNSGVSAARNNALARVAGQWIGFMDSDDFAAPDWLEIVHKDILSHPGVDLLRTWYMDYCEGGKLSLFGWLENCRACFCTGEELRERIWRDMLCVSSCCLTFFKRDVFGHLRFDTSLSWAEDTLFLATSIQHAKAFCQTENTGYRYRARPGSAVRKQVALATLERFLAGITEVWKKAPCKPHAFTALVLRHVLQTAVKQPDRRLRRLRHFLAKAASAGAFDWKVLSFAGRIRWKTYLHTGWRWQFSLTRAGIAGLFASDMSEDEKSLLALPAGKCKIFLCRAYVALREMARKAYHAFGAMRRKAGQTASFNPEFPFDGGLRVLFTPSDNNATSGAFLCLVELAVLLRDNHRVNPIVALPYEGSGTALLDGAGLPHVLVPSADWTVPLATNTTSFKALSNIVFRTRINHAAIRRLAEIIRKYAIDLVDVNTSWGYVGALAAKKAGVPCVWHIREYLEDDQSRTIWNRAAGNRIIASADRVVTVSDGILGKYKSIVPSRNLLRIYDGVDTARFYKPGKSIFSSKPYTFTMVGGVCHYKGHVDFTKACVKLFTGGFRDFRVWFVGGEAADARRECDEIIRQAGMEGVFTFWGRKQDPETYLEKADVFFMCSKCEAFGRVTIEAMLSGCLVIGADTGGTSELVRDGETGLSYHYGESTVDNLLAKMRYAMEHPDEMRRLAAAGRDCMAKTIPFGGNAAEIEKLYREILEERRCAK